MEEKKCTNVNCNTILTPKQIETNNKYCCHRCYLTDENKPPAKRKPIRGKRGIQIIHDGREKRPLHGRCHSAKMQMKSTCNRNICIGYEKKQNIC
jgi:hypothetical protein